MADNMFGMDDYFGYFDHVWKPEEHDGWTWVQTMSALPGGIVPLSPTLWYRLFDVMAWVDSNTPVAVVDVNMAPWIFPDGCVPVDQPVRETIPLFLKRPGSGPGRCGCCRGSWTCSARLLTRHSFNIG